MKMYYIKQLYWNFGYRYEVRDSNDIVCYAVSGPAVSLGFAFTVFDTQGKRLLKVKQRFFSLKPYYDITLPDKSVGSIERFMSLTGGLYAMNFPGGKVYDFMDFDRASVTRNGKDVASVVGHISKFGTCTVEVESGEDPLPIIVAAVAIKKML